MKRKIKFPIFLKFVAIMVTLGTAPLIFVGIRTVDINSKALRETILDLHKEIVISLSDKIYFYLTEISNEIPYITRIITKPDIPWEARETILSTMVDSHPSIVYISLLDSEGREKTKVLNPSLEKYQKLLSFKNEPVFQKFISSKNDFETSDVYYPAQDTKKDSPRINLFYRISGTINILIVLNLKPLFDEIKSKRFRKSGEVFLIDKSGDVISGRAVKAGDEPSIEKSSMVERAIKSLTVGSATYRDNRGIEMVGAYAPVKGIKWFLIVQEPLREAYHSSFLMQRQAVLIIIISALLSAAIAFFFARRLTGPIIDLIRAAAKIARREFSVRVNSRTNDEMNDLILTFNEMGAELKKYDDMQVDKIIAEKTKTEAVIFSIADGIIMTDLAGKILLINKQAKDILNVATDAAEERPIWDFLADKRLQEAFKSLTGDFKDNQLRIKEIDLSSENTVQFFNAGTKPVITQKGEKIGLVTVIRDITLEKEIDRMKDDFLHSITHDLRNPMTSIRGFLKFLIDGTAGPINEQQKKMISTMDVASMRLLSMINDILDLAKLETGRMDLQLADVNLMQVVQRVIQIMEPQIAKKSILVNVRFDGQNQNATLKADTRLIERVINNLLGNAVKFVTEKGLIDIMVKELENGFELTVSDNGDGIPHEYLDKIFDKFQQVAGQRKGGTGLGLTICKYIVESHRGKIWVNSKVHEGSTFGFYIPRGLTSSSNGEIRYATSL